MARSALCRVAGKMIRRGGALAAAAGLMLTVAPAGGAELAREQVIGSIEPVFEFSDAMPTGVTIAPSGRIFVNFPRWGDDVPFTVGELRDGKVLPFPDAAINAADLAKPSASLISVQSVVADPVGRLWILDTGAPSFGRPIPGGAKLVAVDLATNRIVKTLILPTGVVLSTTYLNDVRFDLRLSTTSASTCGPASPAGLPISPIPARPVPAG
jgi:hypothetical protein